MSEGSFTTRWCRLVRVAPNQSLTTAEPSWSDKSQSLLPTEKKIYAIKVADGELEAIGSGYHPMAWKKKKSRTPVERAQKLIAKCKWQLPRVAIAFSVIQVSQFAASYQQFTDKQSMSDNLAFFVQIFFLLVGPPDLAYQTLAFSPICLLELWRYLTYALLHAGFAHLLINVVLQLVISFPLESEVGQLNVALVYVGGILSGSLAASLVPDFTLMVGASSGIYSLLMSHVSHLILVRARFPSCTSSTSDISLP